MSSVLAWAFNRIILWRAVMARTRRKRDDVSWQIPGVREKTALTGPVPRPELRAADGSWPRQQACHAITGNNTYALAA